ncbi:MAG: hypothetical protein M5U28_13470 [Sandaracinaceae bacterium]|nr:hypothetical protein [Sandaracinaceae bacterium]
MSLPLLALVVLAMGLLFAFLRKRGEHQHTREDTTHQHCSACLNAYPTAEVRGMPCWNEHSQTFTASLRCNHCWPTSLAETRAILSADPLPDPTKEEMQDFLRRYGLPDLASELTTPGATRTCARTSAPPHYATARTRVDGVCP